MLLDDNLLLAVLLYMALIIPMQAQAGKVELVEDKQIVSEFQLQDQYGKTFSKEQFSGHWTMIFAGFTSCPDVCPYTLAVLEAVRAELSLKVSPARLPQIIMLAVDPARDQERLASYLEYFHGGFIGVTGEQSQIDELVADLGLFYRFEKPNAQGYYSVSHSSAVALVSDYGEVVAHLYPPFSAAKTANEVFLLMREEGRNG